jgi:hypothetical protein
VSVVYNNIRINEYRNYGISNFKLIPISFFQCRGNSENSNETYGDSRTHFIPPKESSSGKISILASDHL